MIIRAKDIRMNVTPHGQTEITLTTDDRRVDISRLRTATANGKLLVVEIKQHRNKRSRDANAYCWVLCQKIAESIMQTPENVYRKFIRDVGKIRYFPIKNDEVDDFIGMWGGLGIGWFAERAWESKGILGYTTVKAYHGSSRYNTKEMSILIDEIVNECKEMGIDTLPPDEIQELKNKWELTQER